MYGNTEFASKKEYDRARYLRLKAQKQSDREAKSEALEELSVEDRCYLAGLIDGEGSIVMLSCKRLDTCYPSVMVAMTHEPVIKWVAEKLNASYYLHNHTNLRRNPKLKPQYMARVNGYKAKKLCQILLPFLKVKNIQAELVAQFPDDFRKAPGCRLDEASKQMRLAIKHKVDALNSPNRKTKRPVETHALPPEFRQKYGLG